MAPKNPHTNFSLTELLNRIAAEAGRAADISRCSRAPDDSPHTDHDNLRNRIRDRLERLAQESDGWIIFRHGRGEHYELVVGGLLIVPMDRFGCYPRSIYEACAPGQLPLPGLFQPTNRCGLQWDPSEAGCSYVHVVQLLDGDFAGEKLGSWERGEEASPAPWYIELAGARRLLGLDPTGDARPPSERSGRPSHGFPPRPARRSEDGDDT